MLRALALGDMLCAVPAFRALRAANPDAEITLIGMPWAETFVERFDRYLDAFVEFPGFPGIPERPVDPAALMSLVAATHADPFDLVIQLQGNGLHSNGFVQLLGARRIAGYYLAAAGCPNPETFAPYVGHGPEVLRHLALMEFLGFPSAGDDLEFPLDERDLAEAGEIASAHGLGGCEYVCVHPGASIPARRWPADRFAAIADHLVEAGVRVVVTGSAGEAPITSDVISAMRHGDDAVDLAGATSVGGLAALLCRSRLLVSNDTGVAHIADAVRLPSVVLYLASERDRWAALDTTLHAAVGRGSIVGCRAHADSEHRCLRDACAAPRPEDIPAEISVDEVRAAVERQLATAVAPKAEATWWDRIGGGPGVGAVAAAAPAAPPGPAAAPAVPAAPAAAPAAAGVIGGRVRHAR